MDDMLTITYAICGVALLIASFMLGWYVGGDDGN